MAVQTELRKAPFDANLKKNIDDFSNSGELAGYKLVSSFLSPVIQGNVSVILIFQKEV